MASIRAARITTLIAVAVTAIGVAAIPPASAHTAHPPKPAISHRPSTAAKWDTSSAKQKVTNRAAASKPKLKPSADGEVTALRTKYSRTFENADGTYRTQFSPDPVASAGATSNLPKSSHAGIVVSDGATSITQSIVGARSVPATTSGLSTTYRGLLPATDANYTKSSAGLEETLTLHSAAAPPTFTSSLTIPSGDTATLRADRSIAILNHDGTQVATLPAPWMRDASKNIDHDTSTAIHVALTGTAPTYTVTLTPSRAWISSKQRVFPIAIDPSVTFQNGTATGCYYTNPTWVGSGTGTTPSDPTVCSSASGTDNDVAYGSDGHARRIFIKFPDVNSPSSSIPADAIITDATLTMTEKSASNTTALHTQLYRPNGTWSSSTTWATKPGETGSLQDSVTVTPPGANQTVAFKPVAAVRQWVSGSAPNNGLEIRASDTDEASVTNSIRFYGLANATYHPTLTVTWQPQVGKQNWVPQYTHTLSDRMSLAVDLPDRNLVLTNDDDTITGPGQNLQVTRTYNSRDAAAGVSGAFGSGWNLNGGADVTLNVSRENATLVEQDGSIGWFTRHFEQSSLTVRQKDNNANGASYDPSPGLNADLVMDDSTHYRVIFRKTHVEWTFTLPSAGATTGWLSKINDGAGNDVTYTASGSPLQTTKVTDTTGVRSVNFTSTSGVITSASESLASGATGARSWSYGYTSGALTSYVNALGKTTLYCYTGGLLTRIVTPRGVTQGATCTSTHGTDVTVIAYDTSGRVTSISYQHDAESDIVFGFATGTALPPGGSTGSTTETDPYSKVTTYNYDTSDRDTQTDTPLGYHASAKYNTNNDVTASVDPNSFTGGGSDPSTTFGYDAGGFGNLTGVTQPTGASQSASYSSSTEPYQPSATVDDRGVSTSHNYNSNGQVTSATLGSSTVSVRHQGDSGVSNCGPGTSAAYPGAVCETRDADYNASTSTAEHRTLYQYNSLGELVSQTPAQPDHGRTTPPAWTYTYDGQSRLASKTDPRGRRTEYTYDALDRITEINDVTGGTYVTYDYDDDGDMTYTEDRYADGSLVPGDGHQEARNYDALNRQNSDTENDLPAIAIQYDADSRLSVYTSGTTGTTTYGYNDDGTLTSMSLFGGSCTGYSLTNPPTAASDCIVFDVDKDGNRLHALFPGNKANEYWTYDADGKVTETKGTGYTSGGVSTTFFDYTFDYLNGTSKTDHISTRHNAAGSGSREVYTYSTTTDRLTGVQDYNALDTGGTNTASYSFCYDNAGNVTGINTTIGGTCSATDTYDGANQRLGTNYSYDLDGDNTSTVSALPSSGTVRATSWDTAQQPSSLTLNGGSALNSDYAGLDNKLMIYSDTGTGVGDETSNGPLGIDTVETYNDGSVTGTLSAIHDPSQGFLGYRDASGNMYFALVDNQGSVLQLVNVNGVSVDAYHYSPTGSRAIDTNTLPQPMGYLGAYTNSATGLVHLGARYYDPSEHTFTQPDPKDRYTDPFQDNPYLYGGGDPINQTDVGGEFSLGDIGEAVGGVLVGAAAGFALGTGIGEAAGLALSVYTVVDTASIGGAIGGNFGLFAGAAYGGAGGDIQDFSSQ